MKLPLQIQTILSNQSTLASSLDGRYQLAVWVTSAFGPRASLRDRTVGTWTTRDLATISGNPLNAPIVDDAHNGLACAIDNLGHLHVWGNMHAESVWRYVRSVAPYDVSAWEDGVPYEHADTPVAGSMAYPQAILLPDGTLFMTRRYRSTPGEIGSLWASRLGPSATQWEDLGPIATGTDLANGDAPYPNWLHVDPSGRIHIHWTWSLVAQLADPPIADSTYIYSDDQGETWHAVDGTLMTTPLNRGNSAAAKTLYTNSGLSYTGGVATDADGNPHITIPIDTEEVHLRWTGSAWTSTQLADWNGVPNIVQFRGQMWGLGVDPRPNGRTLTARNLDTGSVVRLVDVPSGWRPHFDTTLLREHGVIEMCVPTGDDQPRVVSFGSGPRRPTTP